MFFLFVFVLFVLFVLAALFGEDTLVQCERLPVNTACNWNLLQFVMWQPHNGKNILTCKTLFDFVMFLAAPVDKSGMSTTASCICSLEMRKIAVCRMQSDEVMFLFVALYD